jgi:hypothetical protein
MSGELQIIPVCAPQRMDAEIPAAAQIGGYACLRLRFGSSRGFAHAQLGKYHPPSGLVD